MDQIDLFTNEPVKEESDLLQCSSCKEYKPRTEYYAPPESVRFNTGTKSACKPCYIKEVLLVKQLKRENPYPHKNPVCECCGYHQDDVGLLHLDHCHTTDKYRGYLCRTCNTSIGGLGDNIKGLERAIAYLKKVNNID